MATIDEVLETEGTLDALLNTITCGDLMASEDPGANRPSLRPKHPLCLDSELSVQEGAVAGVTRCEALAANSITSAPVYDAIKGGFIGMLDYRDLVAFVLSVLHKVPKDLPPIDASLEVTDIVKRALTNKSEVPIKLISNLSHENPLVSLPASAPIRDAVAHFAAAHIHRLIILEPERESSHFAGILSQSTIAALVASRVGKLAGKRDPKEKSIWHAGNKTVQEIGLVGREVISVVPEDTVLEALYSMHENKVSSVAIVDRSEAGDDLVGSVSMSDIRAILADRKGWRRLYENCFDFFMSMRYEQGLQAGGDDRVPTYSVHPDSTVIATIEKLAATRAHRIWIVEGSTKLVGVVSLSDIMPLLL
ncbi:cell separation during budding [Thoreauomyces humboldtii]|nr:cell separation during budding [Thoreauomyces humboldtii]